MEITAFVFLVVRYVSPEGSSATGVTIGINVYLYMDKQEMEENQNRKETWD